MHSEIKTIINDTVNPLLKENGFKKKGNLYYIECNLFTKFIELQQSRFNDKAVATFTFNLGLYFPLAYKKIKNEELPKNKLNSSPFCYSIRIGRLIKNEDHWFIVGDPKHPLDKEIELIKNSIEKTVNHLSGFDTFESLLTIKDNVYFSRSNETLETIKKYLVIK